MLNLLKLFARINWPHMRRRRLQTTLCLLGIALGVAVVVAIDQSTERALRSFAAGVETVSGRATHEVVPQLGRPDFPEELLAAVRAQRDIIEAAAPLIEQTIAPKEGGREPLRVLGTDPFLEAPFRTVGRTAEGRTGQADQKIRIAPGSDLTELITSPTAVLLPAPYAERYGLAPGAGLTARVGTRATTLTVLAVYSPGELESGAANLAVMDIAAAQELFGKVGRLDKISLRLRPPTGAQTSASMMAALDRALGPEATLAAPETRTTRLERMIESFRLNLRSLSMLALLVGAFLIYNTLLFAVLQRRRQIGVLRSIGLSRAQAGGLFLLETLALGTVGSLLGVGLGAVLTRYTSGAIGLTMAEIYGSNTGQAAAMAGGLLDAGSAVRGMLLGLGASVLAGLMPAAEAASVPPVTALDRSNLDDRIRQRWAWFAAGGAALLVLTAALCLLPLRGNWAGHTASFTLLLAGAALAVPVALGVVRVASAAAVRAQHLVAAIGLRNISATLSRSGAAIASFATALAMMVGITIMVASFRTTLIQWIGNTIRADIYVIPAGRTAQRNQAFLPPELIARLRSLPQVAAVDELRQIEIDVRGRPANLSAVRLNGEKPQVDSRLVEGRWAEALAAVQQSDSVLISETLMRAANVHAGETITVPAPGRSPVPLRVAGVYRDFSPDGGQVLMHLPRYQAAWSDARINNCALYLQPGINADQFTGELAQRFAGEYGLLLRSNAGLRREVLRVFDNTFAITYAMQAVSVGVAFCGIAAALLALILERARELATLRALGMSLRQLRRMLLIEALSMAAIAAALGMALGTVLAAILIYVINVRSFGWTIDYHLGPGTYAQTVAVALVAGLLAAWWPAQRLARQSIGSILREE